MGLWVRICGFLLLFFKGQQNLRQECQQLRQGQILVLWSLNIIKCGGLFKRKKNTNAIDLKLLLLKYLTLAIFTKPCDHVNTLLNPLRFSFRAQEEACISKEPWSLNFVSVIVNSSLDGTPTSQNGVVNYKQSNLSEESQVQASQKAEGLQG